MKKLEQETDGTSDQHKGRDNRRYFEQVRRENVKKCNLQWKACIVAISQAINYNASELTIYTDSQFVIDCVTKYIKGWKAKNWRLASGGQVKNLDDIKRLDELCTAININWVKTN